MDTEWILALETSVSNATLALSSDGEIVAAQHFFSERSQERDLFAPLQAILAHLPEGAMLAGIVIGTGPGSYNGARVGIAAAQAIAQVHGCGVAGLCSFEGANEAHLAETAWAVGDARRGSFFVMELKNGRPQSPPDLLSTEDFLTRLSNCQGPKLTFESPDRLPTAEGIVEVTSTAKILLKSWQSRSALEKIAATKIPAEAFYLRPPHITKSKKKPLGL